MKNKMIRKLAFTFLAAGVVLVLYGSYHLLLTKNQQEKSLSLAKEVVGFSHLKEVNTQETPKPPITYQPHEGEILGVLEIPRIEGTLPIIEGTDEQELEKGVGHFKGSSFPLQKDQIVLSGHRDTVFRRMGQLEIGDEVIIHISYGTFYYEITDMKIVDAGDRSIITSTYPREVLILSTCYPFSFVGLAPNRYVITALPIQKEI